MANQQLADFIKASLAQNQSQDQIKQNLLQSGWQDGDIAEAFNAVNPSSVVVPVAPVKYAGFWIRWAASMLDGFIVGAMGFVVGILLGIILAVFGIKIKESPFRFLSYIISWSYFIFMTYKYEATFGKKLVGIKVVSDKAEKLTLGQVALRETVGKIVSFMTLMIGYIMAGFTERKQALHDKIASTVVVYKDPNKKVAVQVIIIVLILPIIAIVGILASITLVSLNSARGRANEAQIRATLNSVMPTAIVYFDNNDSFSGFNPSIKLPNCSGKATINISSDGQEMAIFAESCSDSKKYFCIDVKNDGAGMVKEVDEIFVKNKRTSCGVK